MATWIKTWMCNILVESQGYNNSIFQYEKRERDIRLQHWLVEVKWSFFPNTVCFFNVLIMIKLLEY